MLIIKLVLYLEDKKLKINENNQKISNEESFEIAKK